MQKGTNLICSVALDAYVYFNEIILVGKNAKALYATVNMPKPCSATGVPYKGLRVDQAPRGHPIQANQSRDGLGCLFVCIFFTETKTPPTPKDM